MVVAVNVGVKVRLKVQRANRVIDAVNATLDCAPKGFNCIDVGDTGDILFSGMLHYFMGISEFSDLIVALQFIGEDGAIVRRTDVFHDHRQQGSSLNIGHNLSDCVSVALDHTHNNCLTGCTTSAFARSLSTNIGFINFNLSGKWVNAFAHKLADMGKHSPCRLVGNAKFPLKLFGGDTRLSRGHKVCGIEPRAKRSRRLVKDCSSGRRDLITAAVALIHLAGLYTVKLAGLFANWAINHFGKAVLPKPFKTGVVIGELVVEVLYTVGLHFLSPLRPQYTTKVT